MKSILLVDNDETRQYPQETLLLYQQALVIGEQALGVDHPKTKETRNAIAKILGNVEGKEKLQHDAAYFITELATVS